jgi:hypothetical protein
MALQYVMERIALTRHDVTTYHRFREKGQHHINDKLLPVGSDNTTQRLNH